MLRQHLLRSIAATISDYRKGEIPAPNPEHVERWIRQFDAGVQDAMLAEMDHVLKQSYLSREYFLNFLRGLVRLDRLVGSNGFWPLLQTALAQLIGFAIHPTARTKVCPTHWWNVQLFGAQRGELLKRFLVEDGVGKDARFWKLAQSLAALYPPGTDERRWVEGVLARKKGLGL
jgi:hypothetical protein